MDNDGDLDFLAYNILGNEINLYKNLRVEDSLPCDSIRIELADNKWGRKYFGFTSCYGGSSGSNLCLFDYDADGDYDLLNGTISCNYMRLLINQRLPNNSTGSDSTLLADSTWQTNGQAVDLPAFPAAYNIDIDQDGKKDLMVSPNSVGENYYCTWFYKNNTTPGNPSWIYQSDTFLIGKTIDLGTAAYPQFFDFNKDGKPDLFIGSDGYYNAGSLKSRMSYYLNTSTPGNPSFTLQTSDFLGISTQNFNGIAPAFGDLNNDGIQDMVIGHTDGTLSFYKNMAASDNVAPQWQLSQLALKDMNNNTINVGNNAAPFVYDINKDGKPDLVIGENQGQLQYYQNTSTSPGQISLKLITANMGQVKADPNYFSYNYSTPFIGKMDNTGNDYLLLGATSGLLYRFDGLETAYTDTNNILPMIDSQYSFIDTMYNYYRSGANSIFYNGFRTAPTVADIDGSGKYEMVVGDLYGGVKIYKQVLNVPTGVPVLTAHNYNVKAYPNPAKNVLNVSWDASFAKGDVQIDIYSVTGAKMYESKTLASQNHIQISTSNLPSGTYYCDLHSGENRSTTVVTIIK